MAVHYNNLPKSVQKEVDKQHPNVHYKDDMDTTKSAPTQKTAKPEAPHVHAQPEPEKKPWGQSFKQQIMGAASSAGKALGNINRQVQERHRNNPLVHEELSERKPRGKKEKKERKERHTPGQSQHTDLKRVVSSKDVYRDGVKVETIHYAPVHSKQSAPKKGGKTRRSDPLGGLGANLQFRDMLGPMPQHPFAEPSRKGKRKQQPRDGTDFMDHMHNLPKEWKF